MGGAGKILEPEERTAALINLTANMLYLENNAQTQFSEVRILDFSTPFRDAFFHFFIFKQKLTYLWFLVTQCNGFANHV